MDQRSRKHSILLNYDEPESPIVLPPRSIFRAKRIPLEDWQLYAYYGFPESDEESGSGGADSDSDAAEQQEDEGDKDELTKNIKEEVLELPLDAMENLLLAPTSTNDVTETTESNVSSLTADTSASVPVRRYPERRRRPPVRFEPDFDFALVRSRSPKRSQKRKQHQAIPINFDDTNASEVPHGLEPERNLPKNSVKKPTSKSNKNKK